MFLSDFVFVFCCWVKRERKGLGEENKEIRKIKKKGKERRGEGRGVGKGRWIKEDRRGEGKKRREEWEREEE